MEAETRRRCRRDPQEESAVQRAQEVRQGREITHSHQHSFIHSFNKHRLSACCVPGHLAAKVVEEAYLLLQPRLHKSAAPREGGQLALLVPFPRDAWSYLQGSLLS